jgi:hypothetical protein
VLVTFVEVAGITSSYAIFPSGLATLADRDNVIDGEILIVEAVTAVLALI